MSGQRSGLQAIIEEPSNKPIIQRFVRTAIAAAVIPLVSYFITLTLTKSLDLRKAPFLSPPIVSGIVAVLILNIITITFALNAVHEQPNLNPAPTSTESETATETNTEIEQESREEAAAHKKAE